MKVTYHLTVECNCPVDNLPDAYGCRITSYKPIPVEHILSVVQSYKDVFIFQEDLTENLSRLLKASVITEGYHSGVKVTVEA